MDSQLSSTTPNVVTFGEAMMVFNGPVNRPLGQGCQVEATFAGAEINVSIALSRLGHKTRWLSGLGDDLFGREILKTARGEGVDVSGVLLSKQAPTGVMFKSARGWAEPEVLYYRSGSACSQLKVGSFDFQSWQGVRFLFVSGIIPALSESCRELTFEIIKKAKQAGVQIWLDPNYRRKLWAVENFRSTIGELLPLIDMLLPSRDEGEMLTGQTEPDAIAKALIDSGTASVTLKNGDAGAHLFDASGEYVLAPFALEKIVNPIGAGDAFAAGLLSGFLDNLAPQAALKRAHALGAFACCAIGDWEGTPRREELGLFLNGQTGCAR